MEGFQVIGFSAAGVCDRAMEEMIGRNFFDAVVDLAPGGVGEELLGGMRASGAQRLTAAGRVGIPQVVAPGGVNLMSPRKSRYKPEYYQRKNMTWTGCGHSSVCRSTNWSRLRQFSQKSSTCPEARRSSFSKEGLVCNRPAVERHV